MLAFAPPGSVAEPASTGAESAAAFAGRIAIWYVPAGELEGRGDGIGSEVFEGELAVHVDVDSETRDAVDDGDRAGRSLSARRHGKH